jgi:LmbE family N-acetylglucosaminyl deacetylase
MTNTPTFAASALVVAHPDDEALWFSSVFAEVASVICCFEECADLPELGAARRAALKAYPLGTLRSLGRPEPCSLSMVDWAHPAQSEYGMAATAAARDADSEARYAASYHALREDLRRALTGARAVFTHNPWGEYGHPDHVQVSRVVTGLQAELGYRVFYSSYVAPRSMPFAATFLAHMRAELRLPTRVALAGQVKAVYQAHGAWTWNTAYQPPAEECFLVHVAEAPSEADVLPLNCLMTV